MAKTRGTKHHVTIKLSDLNKMFAPSDVIPVPKGFLKGIEYLLSAHKVEIDQVAKDTATAPFMEEDAAPETTTPQVELQVTNFNE